MRRIISVLTAAAMMAAMLVASAAPAMADINFGGGKGGHGGGTHFSHGGKGSHGGTNFGGGTNRNLDGGNIDLDGGVGGLTGVGRVGGFDLDNDDVDSDNGGIGFIGVGDSDLDDDGIDFDDGFGIDFEIEDVESGDIEADVDISNTGNNVNMCPTVLQSANSGNVQNVQGALLGGVGGFDLDDDFDFDDGDLDDLEFEGSDITIAPAASGSCTQTIEQAAAVGVDS